MNGINSPKKGGKVEPRCSVVECVKPAASIGGGKMWRKVKEPSVTFQP